MAKIEINEVALQKLLAPTMKATEAAVAKIAESHAGRPVAEVQRALVAELEKVGVESGKDLLRIATQISES